MQGFFHGGGGTMDISQLHSTMQAIEYACSSMQMHINPSVAEATILSLRQSPQAYQTCQFILENSQDANARFQAAAAIRDVAIKEWGFLSANDKIRLISFCLCYVMQHSRSTDGYVQAKVSAVGAQFLKRGWLDFTVTEKEAFLSEVKQAVVGVHGVHAQFIGINFLDSIVSEFSPSTSSPMGLPREFHEKCRTSLELNYLKIFHCWAQEAALSVTNIVLECDTSASEVKVCSAALHLMFNILNWDFRCKRNTVKSAKNRIDVFSSGVGRETQLLNKSDCVLVQPGPTWRDSLISSGHISWLLGLYGTLRQKFLGDGYWLDSPLAVSARKLIIQLCSLTGTIFPSDNRQVHEQHLLQILSGVMQWIDPPDAISNAIECGRTESEMLDGCRTLLSIATLTTPVEFDRLYKLLSPIGTLSLLRALTCEVVKARLASDTDEEKWCWVARDILLDTWTALLEPTDTGKDSALPPDGIAAAATVFNLIIESELKVAAASAFDDEDDSGLLQPSVSAMDERLSSYALIARAAVEITIPLLSRLFSERFILLHQGRGVCDPTRTLEELYSLLLITGHILADEGDGETPMIPDALQNHFLDILEADHHPVVVLSSSIIKFAEQSLNPEIREALFSPRLMEAVIWFLARWSGTYLMPQEFIMATNCTEGRDHDNQHVSLLARKALVSFCGEHNQGKAILDTIVRISMATLSSYPGEKDLQSLTCYQLLSALVRRKKVCVHLVTLDSWNNLANAFANERSLFSLTSPHQRSLAETLVRSASGMKSSEISNQYVRELMGQMAAFLVDLSSKNDLKTVADAIYSVCCLLERLRGAATATEPRTQKALYDMGVSVMNSILTLLEIYKHESAVVSLLLKFVVDWVDGQIVFLEVKETSVVVNFCMRLLQLYSSHNIGKLSLSLSSSLLREEKTDKYKDLRALLQLLTSLCSKDLVDFSTNSNEAESMDIPQVVYFGLHIVTPLISLEMLKYPKLCYDYFTLLSHMLEVYPEKVAQLNTEAFVHILGSLEFGIHNQDTEVVNMCLGALNALASYHYKERAAGKAGLGSHAQTGKSQEGVLSRFLQSLLHLLLFEDYSADLVGSAAAALFGLILCEQGVYQRLGHELIERQATPDLKSRLANALQALTSSNQLSSSLDRLNHQIFRNNLYGFLTEVRGFLRTI